MTPAAIAESNLQEAHVIQMGQHDARRDKAEHTKNNRRGISEEHRASEHGQWRPATVAAGQGRCRVQRRVRPLLSMVALLAGCSAAMAGIRDDCLSLQGRAVDDVGIVTCEAAIRENDRDGELYAARAYFYALGRYYGRAIADLIKARELGVWDEALSVRLGYAYVNDGEFDRAIEVLDEIIQSNPKNVDALLKRGDAYRHKGEFIKALADLNKSIQSREAEAAKAKPLEYFPEAFQSNAYYYRGLVYSSMNEHDRAIDDFTQAIAIGDYFREEKAHILSLRAEARLRMGNLPQALSDVEKAVEEYPAWPVLFELRGRIREAMGEKVEALQDFRRALSIDPVHKGSLEGVTRLKGSP